MANYIEVGDKIAYHPGYYIQDFIEYYSMPVGYFARMIDVDEHIVEKIIDGDFPIDEDIAEKLEEVTEAPAKYWMKLQNKFDALKKKPYKNGIGELI